MNSSPVAGTNLLLMKRPVGWSYLRPLGSVMEVVDAMADVSERFGGYAIRWLRDAFYAPILVVIPPSGNHISDLSHRMRSQAVISD